MPELKELGALWERTSKAGNFFLSGKVKIDGKETEVICFKNNKKDPKHPDWKIYLSEPKQKPSIRSAPTDEDTPF